MDLGSSLLKRWLLPRAYFYYKSTNFYHNNTLEIHLRIRNFLASTIRSYRKHVQGFEKGKS